MFIITKFYDRITDSSIIKPDANYCFFGRLLTFLLPLPSRQVPGLHHANYSIFISYLIDSFYTPIEISRYILFRSINIYFYIRLFAQEMRQLIVHLNMFVERMQLHCQIIIPVN